jgi:hypothetical protein
MSFSIRVIGLGIFGIIARFVSFMMMDTSNISISQKENIQPKRGVRIMPALHGANPINVYGSPITDARSLLQGCCQKEYVSFSKKTPLILII